MKCHICNIREYILFKNFNDVFICHRCNHIFRKYNGDVIQYHIEKYRNKHPVYNDDERIKYICNIFNSIKSYLSPTDTCLEIGSGDGKFSSYVKKTINNIECCELDKNLSNITNNMGLITHNKDFLNIEDKKYDIIFAFDVLEHILDIQTFIKHIELCTNKYFIFQVPIGRRIKPANPFDGHSHIFSQDSIKNLFHSKFQIKYINKSKFKQYARGPEMLIVMEKI